LSIGEPHLSGERSGFDGPDAMPVSMSEEAGAPAGGRARLVDVRRRFAEAARREADAAAARVEETRRLLDMRSAALAEAQAAVDPAASRAAKDDAHRSFRAAVAAAQTRGQVETAANNWLSEIKRLNALSSAAEARVRHEREASDALLGRLQELSDLAEASAGMADAAMAACREALAASQGGPDTEATEVSTMPSGVVESPEVSGPTVDAPPPLAPAASLPATQVGRGPEKGRLSTDWQVIDLRSPQPQAIIRLMRRDGGTMSVLVDRLAGADSTDRRRWQRLLSNLVDAVVASAIDDACIELPAGQPFWSQFTRKESHEVARGLAALGFRYDGFGGFADARVPTQWDLSLAVGQAGLLPVRVRYWPRADEAAQLFAGVRVLGDTFIAARAPALTLGDLFRILGRRAEFLTDLWNDWPRVRPLLLSTNL
jgi:hypothetical protein